MQIPFEMHHAGVARANPYRRGLSLSVVGVVHIALLYALVHSMTGVVIHIPEPPIDVIKLKDKAPPKSDPVKVVLVKPQDVVIKAPDWDTQSDAKNSITVRHDDAKPVEQTQVDPPTQAKGIVATHTSPPYPEIARRMGAHGAVQLHIYIAADGAVSRATVARSSGNEMLDQTAVAWVIAHWRYRPATVSGEAVAAESDAVVVFDLRAG